MSRSSRSTPAELRAVLAVVLLALVLTVGGLFWARRAIGDDVRAALAAQDVQSVAAALRQYVSQDATALQAKLTPDVNWRTLSREEYDWLITQLAPTLHLNDDVPDDWRTAGLTDPWQRAYQVDVRLEGEAVMFRTRSLGADGQAGTADDVIAPDASPPATSPAATTRGA